jgi:hypothetical protein
VPPKIQTNSNLKTEIDESYVSPLKSALIKSNEAEEKALNGIKS